jgi:hypothetical protein
VILRRPDLGLADDFAAADGEGGLSVAGVVGDEAPDTGSFGAGLSLADADGTSTLVNVLCGSKLAATRVSTPPLRAYTPTEGSMPWVQVPSQVKILRGAWYATVRVVNAREESL